MSQVYSVYGLRVIADGPIPGLVALDEGPSMDVRVWLNRMPGWWESRRAALTDEDLCYRSPFENGLKVWQVDGGWRRLLYHGGYEFLVNPQDAEVWSCWPSGVTLQSATPLLIGPVFGFVLRMREVCCLHASAIDTGLRSIALCGPPHAGKSTAAAAFARHGLAVMSDDIVALAEDQDTFMARSGYPRLCLWPDAAASVCGPGHDLPIMAPGGDKRYLELASNGHRFQPRSLPLTAIYLLGEREEGPGYPKVEPVSGREALLKLAGNTYMNYLLDRRLRSLEFQLLSRLVSRVPVRRAISHSDPSALPALCNAILEDQRSLSTGSGR